MKGGGGILHVAVICIIILVHTATVAHSNALVIQDTRFFLDRKPIATIYFTSNVYNNTLYSVYTYNDKKYYITIT